MFACQHLSEFVKFSFPEIGKSHVLRWLGGLLGSAAKSGLERSCHLTFIVFITQGQSPSLLQPARLTPISPLK